MFSRLGLLGWCTFEQEVGAGFAGTTSAVVSTAIRDNGAGFGGRERSVVSAIANTSAAGTQRLGDTLVVAGLPAWPYSSDRVVEWIVLGVVTVNAWQ